MKRHTIRTPRIVHNRSKRWLITSIVLFIAVLILGGAALLHFKETVLGYLCPDKKLQNPAPVVATQHLAQIAELEEQIGVLEKERDEYRLQAAQYERASQIDQEVVSTVQTDLKALQEERAELRQQVEFYKSLVSGDVTSLQLVDFKVEASDTKQTYNYMLTVSKRAKGQGKVQGNLIFSIVGKQAGRTKRLNKNDLSIQGTRLSMNFQNFQNYQGSFKLPDAFVPETFRIKIEPNGSKFKSFTKDFPWRLIATQ